MVTHNPRLRPARDDPGSRPARRHLARRRLLRIHRRAPEAGGTVQAPPWEPSPDGDIPQEGRKAL